jgi:hypothetical protein
MSINVHENALMMKVPNHLYVCFIAAMHIILRVLFVLYLRVTCICVV